MDKFSIMSRIPQNGGARYDVIVAGGGPAGIGAALAASVRGARALLLEGRAYFGGVPVVSHWMPMNRVLQDGGGRGGAHDIFVKHIKALGGDAWRDGAKGWVNGDNLDIHPDYHRLAVFNALEEVGCDYLLHSPVVGAEMDGNRVTGVKVQSKDGAVSYFAHSVVDATGDADVAYYAGAKMVKGRESDGHFMPVTLGFAVCNVDTDRFYAFLADSRGKLNEIMNEADAEGYSVALFYAFDRATVPGAVSVNNGGIRRAGIVDGTDSRDLTFAERAGIEVAIDFVKIARAKKIPGMENCCLMRVGADLGVRETRRIVGDYVLTEDDVCNGTEFADVIARRYGEIDPGGLAEDKDYSHSMKSGHAYPYRCMLPVGIEGLLAAGRCGSTTHLAQAAGKSTGNMMALGQAAGVAAAIAAATRTTPREVPANEIQRVLKDMGVKL
ncbi:MAG: FAD-dependent oxidoreductase [Oscillospiraceae bacterium]|nr:FAD-dependent oxidoreductase [Oscillospiraceae bacterium]